MPPRIEVFVQIVFLDRVPQGQTDLVERQRALQVDRVTLYNKMRKYGIDRP